MIRITNADFDKFVNLLKKEGQQGAPLTFEVSGTCLKVKTSDRSNKDITIELSDVDYPFMPRITRTETF
jgi:hypothetical protein